MCMHMVNSHNICTKCYRVGYATSYIFKIQVLWHNTGQYRENQTIFLGYQGHEISMNCYACLNQHPLAILNTLLLT